MGCFCIGTNQVDLDAAQERGIPVFNAPFSNTRSVAELVLAEIILLLRGIPSRNAMAHRGVWVKSAAGSHEVRGKTLGIVGYGHIGTQVGVLAESLGMQVLYYDIETKLALGNARSAGSLDALLEAADVVTLHVPETPQTHRMMGRDQLARMKPGAQLINASRGTVVDIDALVDALQSKHLGGAGMDVFPVEPKATGEEFVSPLRGMDNVLLTPHVGGSTEEAQQNIGIGSGREAHQVQQQRLDAQRREFPRSVAARAPRPASAAAHPSQPARRAVGHQCGIFGPEDQRLLASTCKPTRRSATS